jgi:CheY-like chemotaxis protein
MSLILVVEDEAGVAELIAEALTQSNHDVHVAETADDAFTIAKIERVDVILSFAKTSSARQVVDLSALIRPVLRQNVVRLSDSLGEHRDPQPRR